MGTPGTWPARQAEAWYGIRAGTCKAKARTEIVYSPYVYDQLSRLEYAQEGGNIEAQTDASMPQGSQQRDVAGVKGLEFSSPGAPGASVKLDYYASSIGVDLTSSQNISKVRLVGVSPRIQPKTVEVYISQDGMNGDWTKLSDTTSSKMKPG